METSVAIASAAEENGWAYSKHPRWYTDVYVRDGYRVYLRYDRRGTVIDAELRDGDTIVANAWSNAWSTGKRDQVLEWLNAERAS